MHPVAPFFPHFIRPPPGSPLFPYTTLFRSDLAPEERAAVRWVPLELTDDESVRACAVPLYDAVVHLAAVASVPDARSEEHTSELQSPYDLVCRLLLEKKKRISWILSPPRRL